MFPFGLEIEEGTEVKDSLELANWSRKKSSYVHNGWVCFRKNQPMLYVSSWIIRFEICDLCTGFKNDVVCVIKLGSTRMDEIFARGVLCQIIRFA